MNNTAERPTTLEPLRSALVTIDLADLLDGFVARSRVGVRYTEISRTAEQFGLEFKHEHGNVYGRVQLVPVNTTPAPVMRMIIRSDHAAVHGSRRAA